MGSQFILSYYQVEPILSAIKNGEKFVESSLDLGKSMTRLKVLGGKVFLPDGSFITLVQLKKIFKDKSKCYLVRDGEIQGIVVFSEKTSWVRTLYPTKGAPTTMVSGILMHRIKGTDPILDTKSKIYALGKMRRSGRILDTATGLGYSAIEEFKIGLNVTTVEIDPAAIEIAKFNPYSKELFDNPKIRIIIGDILEKIQDFSTGEFDYILHDPPTFKIAGELYSFEFYRRIRRVLREGGLLFHYIGDPNSLHGDQITKGVVRRLKEAGFLHIEKKPEAFGVLACI